MDTIENTFFEGERPLFAVEHVQLAHVKFYPGESAIKEARDIYAVACEFMGKYPFWHNDHAVIEKCYFTLYSRAAIWYCTDIRMMDTLVEAPKMFREVDGLYLEKVNLADALESIWFCQNIRLKDVAVKNGDYLFKNCENIHIDTLNMQGNYSFQYTRNVEIHHAHITSKDAFWTTQNVTVYDSVIEGEYLGWHSKNLKLVNCTIGGTQPLCYATNLVMENCTMKADADLAFEYSTVQADLKGHVTSIKNPDGGQITADSVGEIIIDAHCKHPEACQIIVDKAVNI